MAEMSCVLHVLFCCQVEEGIFSGLRMTTNGKRIILFIPKLTETVLWNQSFKCTSQHGPTYLRSLWIWDSVFLCLCFFHR